VKDHSPRGFVVFLAALIVLGGCDDPSDVGLGLVDQQSGSPTVETIEANRFALSDSTDITGGLAGRGASRVLAGTVDDPVAGRIEAVGTMDFSLSEGGDGTFRSGTLESVELLLSIDYIYGDTTSVLQFDLNDVPDEWTSDGRRADAGVTPAGLIMSFEVDAGAEDVTLDLPAAWVAAHAGEIQTSDFESAFHGFQIRPTTGNAVAGFTYAGSRMIAATAAQDTARYVMTRRHSSVDRTGGSMPAGTILLQDAGRSVAELSFPLDADGIGAAAIHRFEVELTPRRDLPDAPEHFVRPGIGEIGLRAVSTGAEVVLPISTADVSDDPETIIFDNDTIVSVMQRALGSDSNLERLEIYLPTTESGVGFLLLNDLNAGSDVPRAVVTLTPLED
jgi:hypothetical protein